MTKNQNKNKPPTSFFDKKVFQVYHPLTMNRAQIADVYFGEAVTSFIIGFFCTALVLFLIWWYIIAKKNIK